MFDTIALVIMHTIGTAMILFILKEIVEKDRRFIQTTIKTKNEKTYNYSQCFCLDGYE